MADERAPGSEIESLRARLEEAEEILRAIRHGDIDAVVVDAPAGQAVYTLRTADQPYRLLIEQMGEGAVVVTAAGDILYANRRFGELVGSSVEAIIGSPLDRFIPEPERPIAAARWSTSGGYKGHVLTARGALIPAYLSCTTLRIDDLETRALIVTDLTALLAVERERASERKGRLAEQATRQAVERTAAALRESEERLALALEASGGAVWRWNVSDNRVEESGPMYRDLYGVMEEEPMTFITWLERIHPEDRDRLLARARRIVATRGDDVWNEEFRVLHPTRGERWLAGLGRCYRDEHGRALRITGVTLDVTERHVAHEVLKRSEEELRRLVAQRTAQLEELVGELEHFSYTITHDMRAPLRAMRGFAEEVTELAGETAGEEQHMLLDRIITAARRMDALIIDALNYSKAIRQELPLAPVDLGRLLREMLESYPEFHGADAEITVAPRIPLVLGNEAGLTQCFSNLLGNAVKFAQPGKKVSVQVWSELRHGGVRVWVEDNGIGIPEPMLPRVFDMFSRGDSARTGTGIGLALVRKVVDRMGGRVGVESRPGIGSRFWVDLKTGDARPGATEAPDTRPAGRGGVAEQGHPE